MRRGGLRWLNLVLVAVLVVVVVGEYLYWTNLFDERGPYWNTAVTSPFGLPFLVLAASFVAFAALALIVFALYAPLRRFFFSAVLVVLVIASVLGYLLPAGLGCVCGFDSQG